MAPAPPCPNAGAELAKEKPPVLGVLLSTAMAVFALLLPKPSWGAALVAGAPNEKLLVEDPKLGADVPDSKPELPAFELPKAAPKEMLAVLAAGLGAAAEKPKF